MTKLSRKIGREKKLGNVDKALIASQHSLPQFLSQSVGKTIFFLADMLLKKTFTFTNSVDARLVNRFNKFLFLDSFIVNKITMPITVDLLALKTFTKTFTIDGLVKIIQQITTNIDMNLKLVPFTLLNLDTFVVNKRTITPSADTVLSKSFPVRFFVDMVISNQPARFYNILTNQTTYNILAESKVYNIRGYK